MAKKVKEIGRMRKLPAPKNMPAPGSATEGAIKKRSGGRAFRRPDEDIPSHDYVERMNKLGPREGESYLAFVMRIASLQAGRLCVLEHANRCKGNLTTVSKYLGVNRHNMSFHLKQLGLCAADILKFRENAASLNR
jgi:hypothetical protein